MHIDHRIFVRPESPERRQRATQAGPRRWQAALERPLRVIGAACGIGAPDPRCAEGPLQLRERLAAHGSLSRLATWRAMLRPGRVRSTGFPYRELAAYCARLAKSVRALVERRERFAVIGGDHSIAVGTWNGVCAALGSHGRFGLIWIDAHMDAHTPQTTPSGCAHGMPLAFLLGEGDRSLSRLGGRRGPCLAPEHLCLIGVRSHEADEEQLLERLGVRIYPIEEVRRRGLAAVMEEALAHVRRGTAAFGVSVDLDAVDPGEAPGVTTPEPNGLAGADVRAALERAARCADFVGVEIVELNPARDAGDRSTALVEDWLQAVARSALVAHPAVEQERQYLARNYEPLPAVLARAKGVYVWDTAGRRYLDMMAAYSAASFGHSHPRLLRALEKQARRLAVVSRAFYSDRLGPLAERLCALTGMERMLPMNTGAEAVETALKAARKWAHKVKGVAADRAEIIACEGNFHGRTIAAIGMSSEPQYRDGFGPFPAGLVRVPYGDARALEAAITPRSAAFLVEPIQGEAGIVLPPPGYLAECARICRANDVLLICDEVQTGLGRTGRLLACEHERVAPDAILLGKALGGGLLPVSAFLARGELMSVFTPGDHGSTFGGNPLACAVAHEALDLLVEERLSERAAELGEQLLAGLRAIESPLVREVRGRGLFVGVELDPARASARALAERLLAHGILTKDTHATVLRFCPPLVISSAQLDDAVKRVGRALQEAGG